MMTLKPTFGRASNAACLAVMLWLTACGETTRTVDIPFAVDYGAVQLGCNEQQSGLGLTDLRFYLHDVQLVLANGDAVALVLDDGPAWQQQNLALIDLETGTGSCRNGTSAVHDVVRGRAKAGNYAGLRFTLGVPFDSNHADPLLATPPLDDSAMHWSWRGGYKFFRAGIESPNDGFWIHLGSTGCQGTIRNISGCENPNRVIVDLAGYVPGESVVAVDLERLLAGTDLGDGVATDCSSGPGEAHCSAAFAAFGIEFTTGETIADQRVFKTRPAQ